MERERSQINTIRGLIIPSREKELLFRQDYNLSPDILALLLPVTYKGRSMRQKSLMVREHYGIDSNKKIALHLGGIAAWFSCIEMAIAFSRLENWVLLFHGYQDQKYVQELKKMLMQHDIKNVIISDRLYDSLDDVNPILQSCDMGIAWYNNITVGFRTAGKSSGKIPAYLKFGLPVIAKKYPSTIDALEKTGCGVCIDTIDDIALAISSIEKDYATYAENAYAEYDRTYNFELYHSKIIEFIERSVQA
jgi:glycosyltransferase involved in cell wall biosynthesis